MGKGLGKATAEAWVGLGTILMLLPADRRNTEVKAGFAFFLKLVAMFYFSVYPHLSPASLFFHFRIIH